MSPELALSVGLSDKRFPETPEEADVLQDALLQEFEKLSLDEHEKVLFDLHGLSGVVEEDPENTPTKLKELEAALDNTPENEAYLEAKRLNPDYVRSKYLMYLRSELFDVPLTAEKIAQHFEMKRKYFGGGEILARNIRQSDLTPQDIANVRTGFLQMSPVRDSAGRVTLYMGTVYDRRDFEPIPMVSPHSVYSINSVHPSNPSSSRCRTEQFFIVVRYWKA